MGVLIADSGSTKTHWVWLEAESEEAFFGHGMNPYSTSAADLAATVRHMKVEFLKGRKPEAIAFYGAGCSEEDKADMIRQAFASQGLAIPGLNIGHDLLAAARALFDRGSGITCILGTGSSSVLYLEGEIRQKVMSLGYLIGDEGGGMDLGKRLLVTILKETAPPDITTAFFKAFPTDRQQILDEIYFKPRPNRFIASFAPFLATHIAHPFCRTMAEQAFASFIDLNIKRYVSAGNLPVGFIGSIAVAFEPVIASLLSEAGFRTGPFLKSPMEGLITYHRRPVSGES